MLSTPVSASRSNNIFFIEKPWPLLRPSVQSARARAGFVQPYVQPIPLQIPFNTPIPYSLTSFLHASIAALGTASHIHLSVSV
ncbi:hypothetical protein E2P81_ATG11467 [Venturia nashicola]|uniref:Uncharacterized protein n=1 Tax=Venturia nashicola TaxID=86259 RepID=A0A4Z1PBF6_9PEZI|nr:hypothetical protein E6O75_ATG11160 [Venturia nashicola]TLD35348.1 hypothetical protein E2P81_ATG11467 [Venturia nashicola]